MSRSRSRSWSLSMSRFMSRSRSRSESRFGIDEGITTCMWAWVMGLWVYGFVYGYAYE